MLEVCVLNPSLQLVVTGIKKIHHMMRNNINFSHTGYFGILALEQS